LRATQETEGFLGGAKRRRGWALYEKSGEVKIIDLKGKIAPQDYYLIERGDDSTVSDIKADIFGLFTGRGLSNEGEHIVLKDKFGKVIDEVAAAYGWPAGDDQEEKNSMERDKNGNWKNNNEIVINGKDAEGNKIFGTPKAKNSPLPIKTKPIKSFEIAQNIEATNSLPLQAAAEQSIPEQIPQKLTYFIYALTIGLISVIVIFRLKKYLF